MGKKQKVGKARKDKYYHLAKETGFRARSAFKLIQLNRKYDFLRKSRVLIDLCAAPGGWMQVAVQNMPMNSIIVGVDLVPIKPMRGAVGIVADITSEQCRQLLRKELKHFKADTVLHDGAPNVGSSWLHDSFTQARLVLMSLKLATEWLNPGGTFITKVFRSKDYNSVMWILGQFFKETHATKPSSSRDVSAEIFVVCLGYLAPSKIDPKLLDAKYVFGDVDDKRPTIDIFHPPKKVKALGYDDGAIIVFKEIDAINFIRSKDFLEILGTHNKIAFPKDSPLLKHPATTEDIRSLCEDLKVIGKREFKDLLKWRLLMRKVFRKHKIEGVADNSDDEEGDDDEDKDEKGDEKKVAHLKNKGEKSLTVIEEGEPITEEARLELEIANATAEEAKKLKHLKKKRMEMRTKLRARLQPNEEAESEIAEAGNEDLFRLKSMKTQQDLDAVDQGEWIDSFEQASADPYQIVVSGDELDELDAQDAQNEADADDEEQTDNQKYVARLDRQLESMYDRYLESSGKQRKIVKAGGKIVAKLEGKVGEDGISRAKRPKLEGLEQNDDGDDEYDPNATEHPTNPLLVQKSQTNDPTRQAALFFSRSDFKGIEDIDLEAVVVTKSDAEDFDEDDEDDEMEEDDTRKRKAPAGQVQFDEEEAPLEFSDDSDSFASDSDSESSDEDEDNIYTKTKESFEEVPADFEMAKTASKNSNNLDAQGLAMAAMLVARGGKRKLIDGAFNRFSYNDDELPLWFEREEAEHRVRGIPTTKEMADEIKEREREINERPIKKVVEAKARKQRKLHRKLEKVKKRANEILENDALAETEKASQIKDLYKKARKTEKVTVKFVRSLKSGGNRPKREPNVKVKMVDPRQKKERRALAAKTKRDKKKKR